MMKDECNGRALTTFVGLTSKMNSIYEAGKAPPISRAKESQRFVKKNTIRFEYYLDCLFNNTMHITQSNIKKQRLLNYALVRQPHSFLGPS